jgi:NAD(P)H dehydrogenase (quinone)
MKVLIVHCHPDSASFNEALTTRAKSVLTTLGHDVEITDLYAQDWFAASGRNNFTTIADTGAYNQQAEEHYAVMNNGFAKDVAVEIEKLRLCDLLILQFPMWWGSMPALMKGWIDRVFARGVAYDYGQWYDKGLLRGKKAMVSVTTGGGSSMYETDGLNGDINLLLAPIHHNTLHFCGFDVLPPFVVWQAGGATSEERTTTLDKYQEHLRNIEYLKPIVYAPLEAFDPVTLRLHETRKLTTT